MKLIGLNSVVCLLICCVVAWNISAGVIQDDVTQGNDHPKLIEIIKFLVNYFKARNTVVMPEGVQRIMTTVFGNDTWEVEINFYYRHRNTDCNCSVIINENEMYLEKFQCVPISLPDC
ncbi:hypothetical protein RUM43_010005 [Polyplax serrata]|uniref:Uncharacterized protein n=1 Tax=Polyplax serrata TaxID=468196 RepID=A0AAN8PKS2_POLSC